MKQTTLSLLVLILIAVAGCGEQQPTSTLVPTATAEVVPTDTPVLPTATPTATSPPTNTPTATPSATPMPTDTSTPTRPPTATPTSTPTPRPTNTPTSTRTPKPPTDTPTSAPLTDTPTPVPETALVTNVVDGDTIDVEMSGQTYRLRYIGMDTPEQGEPFFSEATEANRALVEGKTVILEKDVSETDQYGRLLRYVYLEDGTFVNAELVRQGYAVVATFPPDVKYQELFLQLQAEAREAGRGLWAEPTPTFTPEPSGTGQVVIQYIFYDGVVKRVESDEYAEIANAGTAAVNLGGWRLNAGDPGQDFVFPGFDLQPGQACRVYTNEYHPEHCGFSFGSGQALWNNKGDCGYLYDAGGTEVSRYCY